MYCKRSGPLGPVEISLHPNNQCPACLFLLVLWTGAWIEDGLGGLVPRVSRGTQNETRQA